MFRSAATATLVAVFALLSLQTVPCLADDAEEDPIEKSLRLRKVQFSGHESFSKRTLRGVLQLQPRSWYAFWQKRPPLDETAVATDSRALERFYEAHGYYGTDARYRLIHSDDSLLTDVAFEIEEGEPVVVRDLQFRRDGAYLEVDEIALLPSLPVSVGARLIEEDYQAAEGLLRQHFLEHGYARVAVRRSATVDTYTRNVRLTYDIEPGAPVVFGNASVEGNEAVATYIIEREVQIEPGTEFHPQTIADARNRILALDLFRVVQVLAEDSATSPEAIDLRVRVEEKPPRSILAGIGYGTEDEFRARFAWSHRNFLGDGRQLSFQARISAIVASGTVLFLQPHLLSPRNRGIVEASHTQQIEETYTVNATRLRPRFERLIARHTTVSLAYRIEQIFTSSVDDATRAAIGNPRNDGLITGPSLVLIRNSVDDELEPSRGSIVAAGIEQYGRWWPGAFGYYKLALDGRRYVSLPWRIVAAARGEISTIDSLRDGGDIPIHDRLYSGGDRSIRGYGRRRLGPRSTTDRPLGGQSRLESSLELRRPVWSALGAAVFVDAGLVSLRAYDLPLDKVEPAAGFGVSYATPVGPLRLDLAFPLDPIAGGEVWRLHFSVGHFF